MYKEDASNLLGVIRKNQEEAAKDLTRKFTKLTAKFDDSRGPQIFKAIHKIENTKKKRQVYQHSYIVSSNDHTVFINLTTPIEDVNFDIFLQKMVM
jgi:formylmethanofuran dehydrogenase subunit E-like metal-binding protein